MDAYGSSYGSNTPPPQQLLVPGAVYDQQIPTETPTPTTSPNLTSESDIERQKRESVLGDRYNRILGCWRCVIPLLQTLRILSTNPETVERIRAWLLFAVQLTRIRSVAALFVFYTYILIGTFLAKLMWLQMFYVLFYVAVIVCTYTMDVNKYTATHYRSICITLMTSIPITSSWHLLFDWKFSPITTNLMIVGYAALMFALVFRLNDVMMYRKKSN